MKKLCFLLVVLLVSVALTVACKAPNAPTPAATPTAITPSPTQSPATTAPLPTPPKVYNWRLTGPDPLTGLHMKGYQKMAKNIYERTGGRLLITLFPGASLGYREADTPSIMKNNLVEMAQFYDSNVVGTIPGFGILQLPFFFKDMNERIKGTRAAKTVLSQQTESGYNFKFVESVPNPFAQLITNKKVTTLAEMKGLKIRISGAVAGKVGAAIGISVQSTPMADVYMALSTGTLDGITWGAASALDFKLYEIMQYATIINMFSSAASLAINKTAYEELSPDVRKVLDEEIAGIEEELTTNVSLKEKDLWKEFVSLSKDKAQLVELQSGELEKMMGIAEQAWKDFLAQSGPSAQSVYDAILKALGR